jgi:hypothetical protein
MGFAGCVGTEGLEEEDPEHPASVRVQKASKKNKAAFLQETSIMISIV